MFISQDLVTTAFWRRVIPTLLAVRFLCPAELQPVPQASKTRRLHINAILILSYFFSCTYLPPALLMPIVYEFGG